MKNVLSILTIAFSMMFFSAMVLAQETVPLPAESVDGFFTQVLTFVKQFGGLPWVLKIAGIAAILISTLKVSVLRELIWDKLGNAKAWAGPLLGLIFGLASLGSELNWASALAFVSAGAGAIILHELLNTVKAIPGIGSVWLSVIEVIQKILGGKKSP